MKINIVGSMFGTDGYSNHTRQLANALYELNPDIKLDVPLTPDYVRWVNDAELNMITKENRVPDVTIAILTPPFWRIVLGSQTKHFVGFLVWEGSNIPEYWIPYLLDERVDQIWVPSQHTKDAIIKTMDERDWSESLKSVYLESKIKIVPHGVDLNIFKPLVPTKKDWLKKPEPGYHPYKPHKFTFICNKGWRGGMEDRGGVGYVLKAYCEEFKKDEPVSLLLKLNPSYIKPEELKQKMDELNLPKERPEIKINCGNILYKNLPEIYCQGDVYVCAQRADAFNLCGLEAMGCGLPTIQTTFGGQEDYMNVDNSWFIPYKLEKVKGDVLYEECKWAIPDIERLKSIMRYCFNHRGKIEIKEKKEQAIKDVQNWTWNISAKKALGFLNELT